MAWKLPESLKRIQYTKRVKTFEELKESGWYQYDQISITDGNFLVNLDSVQPFFGAPISSLEGLMDELANSFDGAEKTYEIKVFFILDNIFTDIQPFVPYDEQDDSLDEKSRMMKFFATSAHDRH